MSHVELFFHSTIKSLYYSTQSPNFPTAIQLRPILEKSPKVRNLDSVFSWQADKEAWREEDARLIDNPTDR